LLLQAAAEIVQWEVACLSNLLQRASACRQLSIPVYQCADSNALLNATNQPIIKVHGNTVVKAQTSALAVAPPMPLKVNSQEHGANKFQVFKIFFNSFILLLLFYVMLK